MKSSPEPTPLNGRLELPAGEQVPDTDQCFYFVVSGVCVVKGEDGAVTQRKTATEFFGDIGASPKNSLPTGQAPNPTNGGTSGLTISKGGSAITDAERFSVISGADGAPQASLLRLKASALIFRKHAVWGCTAIDLCNRRKSASWR